MTNHSRLVDLELDVREHMVLVGPNDVGKSSLLRCLDLILGASNAQLYSRITIEDLRDPKAPLVIEADLADFDSEDRALFPDEINTESDPATLTVQLTASFDDHSTLSIQRIAPGGGTNRQLSREQLTGIGWRLLGATSGTRDLRDTRWTILDDILGAVELGEEQEAFESAIKMLGQNLDSSTVLGEIRGQLSDQLSRALPERVSKEDLAFVPGAVADSDVLRDVRLQVDKKGVPRNLSEQSDGMRALYAIALYDLASVKANMVGIDEPEIHLHPTSQRSLAGLLRKGPNQKFLATHSPDIVSAFSPDCIVSVRSGGGVAQPAAGFLNDDEKMLVRWWVRNRLEPLTARRVIGVEGISDRIILDCVANLTNRSLDRLGVTVLEVGGSNEMAPIRKLFGRNGFDIPLSRLIDRDAADKTAKDLGINVGTLADHSVWVSDRDLEEEYVSAIGPSALWSALEASTLFKRNEPRNAGESTRTTEPSIEDVAEFCRNDKYKVRAAMVAASVLNEESARRIRSVGSLLDEISE